MAAQGLRDMGDGREAIANPAELLELRARGRLVSLVSLAGAALATLFAVLAAAM